MKLTIVRGLPGSGKSTYAKSIGCIHIESDMYFMKDGVYCFNREELRLAHDWCKSTVYSVLLSQVDCVVSNTFTTIVEMQYYVDLAKFIGCEIDIVTCLGEFGSIHDVPEVTIEKMKARFVSEDALRVEFPYAKFITVG